MASSLSIPYSQGVTRGKPEPGVARRLLEPGVARRLLELRVGGEPGGIARSFKEFPALLS